MEKVIFLPAVAAFCLLVAGCSRLNTSSEDVAPEAPPPAVAAAATEPAPSPPAPPTPPPPRLASDGVFFLLAKKSIETDVGIIGWSPGTRVLRQPDGKFSAEGQLLELHPSEITNDLDLAARVAGADARAQAAIRQAFAARPAPLATGSEPPAPDSATTASSDSSVASSDTPPQRASSSLGGTDALGGAHTKIKDGWLYQKNAVGEWDRVRKLR